MPNFSSLISMELQLREAQDAQARGEPATLCETSILSESFELSKGGMSADDIKILMRMAMNAGEKRASEPKKVVPEHIVKNWGLCSCGEVAYYAKNKCCKCKLKELEAMGLIPKEKKIFREVFDKSKWPDGEHSRVFEDEVDIGAPHMTYGPGTDPALGESLHPEFKGKLRLNEPYLLVAGRHFKLLNWPDGCLPNKTATGWEAIYEAEVI